MTFDRIMIRMLVTTATLGIVLAVGVGPASAARGSDLDETFAGDGRVTTDLGGDVESGGDVVRQPDGGLIVVGRGDGRFAITRYRPNGALDPAFSEDGKQFVDVFPGGEQARAAALQPDGKIVVAGSTYDGVAETGRFAIARLDPDGTLDASFSGDGRATVDFDGIAAATAVQVAPGGAITVAGSDFGERTEFAVARLSPNGSLDASFSGDGRQKIDFGDESQRGEDLALQQGGETVVVGRAFEDFAVARLLADGSPDPGFSGDGRATTDFGNFDSGEGVAVDADGNIVVAGRADAEDHADFGLARFTPAGSLDTSFAGDGRQTTDFWEASEDNMARDVLIQPDGRIVAAGETFEFNPEAEDEGSPRYRSSRFALARYDPDGSPEASSFAPRGEATIPFPGYEFSGAAGVALQPDGKIVAAGYASARRRSDFAVARVSGRGFVPYADLEIAVERPASVRLDQRFAFTAAVTNRGPQTAGAARLSFYLRDGQRFLAGSPGCRPGGRFVFCSLGNLRNGDRRRVGVTLESTRTGRVRGYASAASNTPDRGPGENSGDLTVTVTPPGSSPPPCPMIGTAGADIVYGTPGRNRICGYGGDDILRGEGGDDTLLGGGGADALFGGPGSDDIFGQSGADSLYAVDGLRGNDLVDGGADPDACRADPGDRSVSC